MTALIFFTAGEADKTYLALAKGRFQRETGSVDLRLPEHQQTAASKARRKPWVDGRRDAESTRKQEERQRRSAESDRKEAAEFQPRRGKLLKPRAQPWVWCGIGMRALRGRTKATICTAQNERIGLAHCALAL